MVDGRSQVSHIMRHLQADMPVDLHLPSRYNQIGIHAREPKEHDKLQRRRPAASKVCAGGRKNRGSVGTCIYGQRPAEKDGEGGCSYKREDLEEED